MAEKPFRPIEVYKDSNLSARQFRLHVRNINNMLTQATPEQVRAGSDWYEGAHMLARHFGEGDASKGAGIIAALSPQTGWGVNLNQAHQLVNHPGFTRKQMEQLAIPKDKGGDRSFIEGTPLAMHPGETILKAYSISHGGAPAEEVFGGNRKKTGHFYRNIMDPENPDYVTIDQHAHDLAVNRKMGSSVNRGLSAVSRYQEFARAYLHVGREHEMLPDQVQATTWTAWRDKYPSRVPDQSFDVSRFAGPEYRHLNIETRRKEWDGSS